MSDKPAFFTELKRRNVIRVAGLYLVGAWLLIQIASTMLPAFDGPAWALRGLIITLALGFIPALVFSWVFELTPQGLKRDEEVAPEESIAPQTARRMNRMIIAVLVLALGYFAVDKFVLAPRREAALVATTARSHPAPAPNEPKSAVNPKSIAVLPFDNLSHDPDNAYFAEGVQDEILTRLAKVADLKVISRTSTQRFKSAPENLPEIAKQLGVMNILEGSVQRVNDQVRVNVQLINASNDAHLWAETYDRKLTDIFTVESEIAKTIADTLQAKLTGSEMAAMAKAPTADTEANELYAKGRFFWNKRTGADLRKAIEYFNQAIAKDPDYARAYVGLANSYLLLPYYGAAAPQDSIPHAKAAVKKALELDNTLGEAYATSAKVRTEHDFEFEQGITEFERAVQLSPNYATAHHWFASGPLMALARSDRAIAEGKRAVELDPLSLIANAELGLVYLYARRYDEAIAQFRKTIELDSRFYLAHYELGTALLLKGQSTEAIAAYRTAVELNDDPTVLALLGQAYARVEHRDEAQKILARLTEEAKSRYVSGYSFAILLTSLGDKEGAVDALERSYRNGEGNDIYLIRVDPLLDDLHGDPRFEALAEKIVPAREFAKSATTAK